MLFAYIGPETILPVSSVIAAAAGVVMMCGRRSARLVVAPIRRLADRRQERRAVARLDANRRIDLGPDGRGQGRTGPHASGGRASAEQIG